MKQLDKSSHEEVERLERLLNSVLEASTQGILSVDRNGVITLANAGAEHIFGYLREEMVGQPVHMLLPENFRRGHTSHLAGYFKRPKNRPMSWGSELIGRRKDSSTFPAEITLSYISDKGGPTATAFVTDITERKKMAEQMAHHLDAVMRLQKLGALAAQEGNLETILTEVVDAAIAISAADFGSIQLLDAASGDLRIAAQRGFPAWWLEFWGSVSKGKGTCGMALDIGERVIVEDVEQHPIFSDTPALDIQRQAGVRAVQSTPLISRSGKTVGMFSTHYRTPHRPDDRALRLLDLLAHQAADIIQHVQAEAALRESEGRLRGFMENAPIGIAMFDRRMRYLSANPQWLKEYGLSPDVVGKSHYEVFPEIPERWKDVHRRCLAGETIRSDGDYFRRADGTEHWLEWGVLPWRTATGDIGGIYMMERDITDRKKAEAGLQWANETLSAIVDAAPVEVITVDRNGLVMTWNPAAERMFGYTADETVGRPNPAIPNEARDQFRDMLSRALGGETIRKEVQRIRKDGTKIDVSLSLAPLHGDQGGVVILAEDVTDQKKAKDELIRVRAALAEAQEAEARRLARDIHDDIAQRLAFLAVDIARAAANPPPRDQLDATLQSFQSRILEASEALRRISHRLHPSVLDDLGVSRALEDLCDQFSQRTGVSVRFCTDNLPDSIPSSITGCLYRVAQEALNNSAKHAKASDAHLTLTVADGAIEMNIIDSGVGFDTSRSSPGLGLYSMHERVTLVNGTLAVDSEPGAGTRITVRVPLP